MMSSLGCSEVAKYVLSTNKGARWRVLLLIAGEFAPKSDAARKGYRPGWDEAKQACVLYGRDELRSKAPGCVESALLQWWMFFSGGTGKIERLRRLWGQFSR